MAAYDPKRPRPAELADDPPPVDALLEPDSDPIAVEPAVVEPSVEEPVVAEPAVEEPVAQEPAVDPVVDEPVIELRDEPTAAAVRAPSRQASGDRPVGVRAAEVPVAPAPEVGTTNRAVLYASLGAAAVLVAVLVLLRLRRRPPGGPSSRS